MCSCHFFWKEKASVSWLCLWSQRTSRHYSKRELQDSRMLLSLSLSFGTTIWRLLFYRHAAPMGDTHQNTQWITMKQPTSGRWLCMVLYPLSTLGCLFTKMLALNTNSLTARKHTQKQHLFLIIIFSFRGQNYAFCESNRSKVNWSSWSCWICRQIAALLVSELGPAH